MTAADELRAAIARDCPHRLADYDRHRALFPADWQPTVAFRVHWWTEHHISRNRWAEWRLDRIYRRAAQARRRARVRRLLNRAARRRERIHQQVIKEIGDA